MPNARQRVAFRIPFPSSRTICRLHWWSTDPQRSLIVGSPRAAIVAVGFGEAIGALFGHGANHELCAQPRVDPEVNYCVHECTWNATLKCRIYDTILPNTVFKLEICIFRKRIFKGAKIERSGDQETI